jgi:hypothetical protein
LLVVELLERRELLSGISWADPTQAAVGWQGGQTPASVALVPKPPTNSKAAQVQLPLVWGPNQSSSPTGEGYTPAQMQRAYGFNQIALSERTSSTRSRCRPVHRSTTPAAGKPSQSSTL